MKKGRGFLRSGWLADPESLKNLKNPENGVSGPENLKNPENRQKWLTRTLKIRKFHPHKKGKLVLSIKVTDDNFTNCQSIYLQIRCFLMIVLITVVRTQLPVMFFFKFISNVFYCVWLHICLVLLWDLVHIVRDVGRNLSFLVTCRLFLGVDGCKKILINLFILLISLFTTYNHFSP